jgi:hypothetical protein
MATKYANGKIVTNGLALVLDAADRNSYPGSGTTWRDLSGNANNGTLINSPTFNSSNGGSIYTNGSNQYIISPYSGSATENFTFSGWFKNDDYSENKHILCRGRDANGNGWSAEIMVRTSGVAMAGVVTTVPSTVEFDAFGTSVLALNTWYYVTGVWTAGSSIKVYVNGILEATTNTTSTSLRSSTNGWCIGSQSNTLFSSGYNAIAQIYNRVLSNAEILQNYNSQKVRFGLT